MAFYMAFIDDEDDREKFEIIYNEYRKRMVRLLIRLFIITRTPRMQCMKRL